MKKSVLILATMMTAVLASCAPGQPVVDTVGARENTQALPQNFSMLDLGRALSKGAVDIYDPWLPTLTVPTPDFAVADPLATFPVHPFMLVRDENVRVYSLNSDALDVSSSFSNILSDVELNATSEEAPPIPLVSEEPLPP